MHKTLLMHIHILGHKNNSLDQIIITIELIYTSLKSAADFTCIWGSVGGEWRNLQQGHIFVNFLPFGRLTLSNKSKQLYLVTKVLY